MRQRAYGNRCDELRFGIRRAARLPLRRTRLILSLIRCNANSRQVQGYEPRRRGRR